MGESLLDLLIENKGGLQWLVDELGGGDGQSQSQTQSQTQTHMETLSMPRLSGLSDEGKGEGEGEGEGEGPACSACYTVEEAKQDINFVKLCIQGTLY